MLPPGAGFSKANYGVTKQLPAGPGGDLKTARLVRGTSAIARS
jgi:hypothetical protein